MPWFRDSLDKLVERERFACTTVNERIHPSGSPIIVRLQAGGTLDSRRGAHMHIAYRGVRILSYRIGRSPAERHSIPSA